MSNIVMAVYEGGVLRPMRPLNLREHQTVRLQVLPENPADEVELALLELVKAGLLTLPPGQSDVPQIPENERRRLADVLGQAPGKSLSEIINEDRGPW